MCTLALFNNNSSSLTVDLALTAGLKQLCLFDVANLTDEGVASLTCLTSLTRLCMVEAGDGFYDDIQHYRGKLFPDNRDWDHLLEVHFVSKVRAAHALRLNSITRQQALRCVLHHIQRYSLPSICIAAQTA
jgi:hypothetical protein